jgi:phosphoribosylformylglycinamidine synthase PurS subunit
MKAKIHVMLKEGILDPQGKAVEHALATLGFGSVRNVRVGKHIELDLDESGAPDAEAEVKAMCEKLLANTIIEDYTYELASDRARPLPKEHSAPIVELMPAPAGSPSNAEPVEVADGAAPSHAAASEPGTMAAELAETPEDRRAGQEALARARRILSDLALLNPEAVKQGLKNGTFRQTLKEDLEEGLRLFRQQVAETVRAKRDYFEEAIETFIRERKGTA